MKNEMKKYLKEYLYQLVFLLEASVLISLITVVYFSLFELGIYFSLKLYHSSLFYLGAIFIVASSWLCTKWAVGARSSGHDLGRKYFYEFSAPNSFNDKVVKSLIEKYFTVKVIFIKILSSSLASFGGVGLGREGPLVHITTAALLSFKRKMKDFDIEPSSLLIIGTCVGFAAVFREPIIGLIYVLEIFGFKESKKCLIQNLILVVCTTYLSKFLLELVHVESIHFSLTIKAVEDLLIFIEQIDFLKLSMLLMLSIVLGAIGGVFIQITRYHSNLYLQESSKKTLIILPLVAGSFIILLAHLGSIKILGPGGYLLKDIFTNHDINAVSDFLGQYLNTILSLVAGCAGGVIVPSLSLGALLGDLISEVFAVSSAFMIILCTTSFLSSIIKAPVTAAALIIMFIKPDINIAIYIIITACLSHYLSFFIKRILGYKVI